MRKLAEEVKRGRRAYSMHGLAVTAVAVLGVEWLLSAQEVANLAAVACALPCCFAGFLWRWLAVRVVRLPRFVVVGMRRRASVA